GDAGLLDVKAAEACALLIAYCLRRFNLLLIPGC
ncbi:hypothetical protein A2U01_0085449, partial [Trifolium medium]|nr:hypothetical protein [Trifolium medium]